MAPRGTCCGQGLQACPHASTACYNESGVQDRRRRNCAASNSWGSGGNPQPPDFGLWSVRFPLVLVRTGRRLPVQALCERRVLVALTGYPRGGAPGLRVFVRHRLHDEILVFGLWRICFPPVLVRTGRRLPVQALGERGVLVSLTGYPRGGAPGPG